MYRSPAESAVSAGYRALIGKRAAVGPDSDPSGSGSGEALHVAAIRDLCFADVAICGRSVVSMMLTLPGNIEAHTSRNTR